MPMFDDDGYLAALRRAVGRARDAARDASPLAARLQGRRCYSCPNTVILPLPEYPRLCRRCGSRSQLKRDQTADLTGRVAVLTGGRRGIGYSVGLKLLRAGAHVVVTTRFPADAAERYAGEPDFDEYAARLEIHSVDFRSIEAVEHFADHVAETLPRLDILVNNAAQAVRRPPAYYRSLVDGEMKAGTLPQPVRRLLERDPGHHGGDARHKLLEYGRAGAELVLPNRDAALSALLTQVPLLPEDRDVDPAHFPGGRDSHRDPLDLRTKNSWSARLEEVSTVELLEVQLINSVAPFVLCRRLVPFMRQGQATDRWIVNVTSTEGHFSGRHGKDGAHPHTNVAKAGLNMLTLSIAEELAAERIFVNAVDTGWVSHPRPLSQKTPSLREAPLDFTDGAARILDPIFRGILTGRSPHGKLWKDFEVVRW